MSDNDVINLLTGAVLVCSALAFLWGRAWGKAAAYRRIQRELDLLDATSQARTRQLYADLDAELRRKYPMGFKR